MSRSRARKTASSERQTSNPNAIGDSTYRDAGSAETGGRQPQPRRKSAPDATASAPDATATPPQALNNPELDAPVIVGIGASAGGLEALRQLVAQLPDESRFTYIVAQHLSPTHQSMLVPLLSRETRLPVLEVSEGLAPEPNVVYITPARWNVAIREGRLHLTEATTPGTPKPSIDFFFASLAEDQGEMGVAVVLSGTGSDGARGVRAVRAAGGITFAQDEQSAKYSGMPRAAVESGCVDYVLPPGEIARQLGIMAQLATGQDLPPLSQEIASALDQIFDIVRQQTGVDFRIYKETTVRRRIRRRMVATECVSMDEYLLLLRRRGEEVARLSQEILISVTSFFRESEAFDALRLAIDEIVAQKADGDDLRVWVAGCATGEEAYSVAILVFEALKAAKRRLKLQIFATDIDASAMLRARRGVFPKDEIVHLSPDRTRAYFTQTGQYIQVSKQLRESILFSNHNLVRDPPFLRMDLISCRNVLIYFKPEIQGRLLRIFHGALRQGGYLFLGRSETTHQQDRLFGTVDERARIYTRKEADVSPLLPSRDYGAAIGARPERVPGRARSPLSERVLQAVLGSFLPAVIVVDESLNLKHVYGDVSPFVSIQPGQPNLNLYALAHPSLRVDIRSLVMKAQRTPKETQVHAVQLADSRQVIRLGVAALPNDPGEPVHFVVMLQRAEVEEKRRRARQPLDAGERDQQMHGLEEQLAATRENLQTVIEELETSNEELQSLNEELSSANEELQSANEELETSNEELQSTNEELTTVNEELETKTHELIRLNSDLKNVKDSLAYPLIVLDEHLRVTLFNPQAAALFELAPTALGQGLFSLPAKLDLSDLRAQLEAVIASGEKLERQFEGEPSWVLHAHPYVDESFHRKGALLTFVDNTAIRRAEVKLREFMQQLAASERFAKSTIDAFAKHLCVIDENGAIVTVNRAWSEFISANQGTAPSCGVGSSYIDVCTRAAQLGEQDAARFLDGLRSVMIGKSPRFVMEYRCDAPGQERWFEVSVTPFQGEGPRCFVVAHENITRRKGHEQLLTLQAQALDGSVNGIVIAEVRGPEYALVYVNRAFEEISGYSREEVIGRDCRFLQGADRSQPNIARIRNALREGREERTLLRNYRKDGTLFWNELSLYPIADPSGTPRYFVGVQRDMTSLVASEEALRSSIEREKLALGFAGVGMFSWEVRGGLINASDIMLRLLGMAGASPNLDQATYRTLVHEEDRPIFDDAIKLCLAGHQSLDIEYRVLWPDGSIHWLHTKGDVENTTAGLPQRLLCLSQDITQRKESDERMRFIAHHDALTGLPNRTLLRDRLQVALNAARRNRTKVAVLFVDLDHFKHVNDSLGHHVGDQLLQSVSNRLRAIIRDSDTLCRHSGDEYVVVLPNVHDSGEAAHVAEKIVEALSLPHHIDNHELVVTPSIGVSLFPEDGDKIDVLIRNADAAMYHAKGSGRKNFQFFMPEMNRKEQDRLTVTTELRHALERNELQLHYQPQLSLDDGSVVGVEALVRWMHPTRGIVYPNEFIPIAEDYELVLQVGEWVLREACRQAHDWVESGIGFSIMAVNFSAMQFRQRNIIATVSQALHDSQLDPSYLEMELTESAIMHNVSEAADTLTSLHQLGIRLAIDDFGTGYSSLQHLRHFPIDKLKIDRSFIGDLPADNNSASIVRAMIMLGNNLKLDVVAEGVETKEQFEFLRGQSCSAFQGFLTAPALSAPAFAAFVKERQAARA
jgi:two-component system CheB/CheR fusion protein